MIRNMNDKDKEKNTFAANWFIVAPIALLVLILISFTFLFIVDENDCVVITRFGAPQLERNVSPGLRFKYPYPIEEVWRQDKRIHVFPSKYDGVPTKGEYEEVYTADKINVIVSVSLTWSILYDKSTVNANENLIKYMNNVGTLKDAETKLNDLLSSAKTAIFGKHVFGELINENAAMVKLPEIEKELYDMVRYDAMRLYAIDVKTLTVSHLGLPEKTTKIVFERMRAERKREADRIRAEGERDAANIRAKGDRESQEIISKARKEAMRIKSEGDLAAAESYKTFRKSPELAMFLRQLKALPALVRKRTFLYMDLNTPPLGIMSPDTLHNLRNNVLTTKKSAVANGVKVGK